MSQDTISDILTCIRNADMAKKETVRIGFTSIAEKIVKILLREGFIKNTRKHRENQKSFLVLTLVHKRNRKENYIRNRKKSSRTPFHLKRVSRPGLRIYSTYQKIPRILGGMGIVILSTSRGLITDREARLERVGGEILCYIW
uniref:Small ribosomal subunit protein uS8c n=1 Tax=Erodium gruinum TaxID=337380 RepID=A0A0A0PFX2_9ROSI|nr:ribosomal protein S8 [Erodium gruinum]AHH80621.1 ribosomal protein S8 [Erodium gruinum]